MRFTMVVESEDDVFAYDDKARAEMRTLLAAVLVKVAGGEDGGGLLDSNGNTCGGWSIEG